MIDLAVVHSRDGDWLRPFFFLISRGHDTTRCSPLDPRQNAAGKGGVLFRRQELVDVLQFAGFLSRINAKQVPSTLEKVRTLGTPSPF